MLRLLKFLRVTDDDNNLSITNLIIMAIMVNMGIGTGIGETELMGMVAALMQYGHKRHVTVNKDNLNTKAEEELAKFKEQIVLDAESKINELKSLVEDNIKDQVNKLATHDDMIDKLKVQAGFKKIGN